MTFDAEILIVGSGPAGIAAAIPLVRAGRDVLVLERRDGDEGVDYASGELFSPAAQAELARIELPLEGDWVLDRVYGVRNVYPDLSWTYHRFPDGFSYVQADRGGFNNALRRRFKDCGGRLRMGARVTEVATDSQAAIVRTGDGAELRAPLLIDAAGRYSPTLRSLQLKEEDPEFCQIGVALFFESFAGAPLHTWDRHLHGHHGTTISGSRIRPGLFRYILETDLADKQAAQLKPVEFYETMASRLDPWVDARIRREPRVEKFWSMAPLAYRVREVARDRILLAGDAAGYLSPFTGQGVEFAMRMGRLAATAALLAFERNDFGAATFRRYIDDRKDELDTALAFLRHQLRILRDRDGLLRAAHDPHYRAECFGPFTLQAEACGNLNCE